MSRSPDDLAVRDLHDWLGLGLVRGGSLLTAGEVRVVRRILALEGDAASLYARLSARKVRPLATHRLTLPGGEATADAVNELIEAGLLTRFVPWPARLEALAVEELRACCAEVGKRRSGARQVLLQRLAGTRAGASVDVILLCHARLLRRLLRFARGRVYPDRNEAVLARTGVVKWASYAPTSGAAVFSRRAHLRAWEVLVDGVHDASTLLDALDDPRRQWPPGRLDPRRKISQAVLDSASRMEREGLLVEAESLYVRLAPHLPAGALAVRIARVMERQGRAHEAWTHLAKQAGEASLGDQVAIERAGRRLARTLRCAWTPAAPLRMPTLREIDLVPTHASGPRPQWEERFVEGACRERLERAGRKALHAEGPLWRTLFALLFADTYFVAVPGQLPVPFLSGPLDLGTPSFRRRRASQVEGVLAEVRAGGGGTAVASACERWWGTRIRGARYDLASPDDLVAVAEQVPPEVLVTILEHLLARGLRAVAGLPDLVVLGCDGATRVPGLHPSTLPSGLHFVEVKSPSDTLRDEQRAWHHRLLMAGASVFVWRVRAVGTSGE